jgi:hypothetical protein
MAWILNGINSNTTEGLNLYATGNYAMFHMLNSSLTAGQDWFPDQYGFDVSTNKNAFGGHFHYAGSGSTSNYYGWTYSGAGTADVWRTYADREFVLPGIATSPSTAPACFNGTLGGLTNVGCTGGSGAWTNITSSLSISGCGTNTGGVCTVSGTTTTNLSVTSIPAHNRIQIVIYGASSVGTSQGTAAYVVANFNTDVTSGHYIENGLLQSSTSAPAIQASTSTTLCVMGQMGTTGTTLIGDIPFYADTSFGKNLTTVNGSLANFWQSQSCGWTQTSAITQIDISLTLSAHYTAGTKLMVLVQD